MRTGLIFFDAKAMEKVSRIFLVKEHNSILERIKVFSLAQSTCLKSSTSWINEFNFNACPYTDSSRFLCSGFLISVIRVLKGAMIRLKGVLSSCEIWMKKSNFRFDNSNVFSFSIRSYFSLIFLRMYFMIIKAIPANISVYIIYAITDAYHGGRMVKPNSVTGDIRGLSEFPLRINNLYLPGCKLAKEI